MKDLRIVLALCMTLALAACDEPLMYSADAVLPDGGVYKGDIENGLFQGSGRLSYPSGTEYRGQFSDGMFDGKGVYTYKDGLSYDGSFVKGQATGSFVVLNSKTELEYRGDLLNWVYQGQGTLKTDEYTYVGEFDNGLFDGEGHLKKTNGASYVGHFKEGVFHGQGVYRQDSNVYEGEFVEGQLNGQGTISLSDGSIYIGLVSEWVADGEGQQTDSEGNVIIGEFESGYAQGQGRFIGIDGRQYEGGFEYGEFDGSGELLLADQSVYSGSFSYGKYHGEGTLSEVAEEGSAAIVKTGKWRRGLLVHNTDTDEYLASQAEVALEQHQSLLNTALASIKETEAETINAYFVGVAGDGTQSVFRREIEFVDQQIQKRYGTQGRSISLINHHDSAGIYPLATTRSFASAVQGLSRKMDLQNDVLFVYLSSHGSKRHQLSLDHDSINLPPMSAEYVAQVLRETKVKWKVVMVSACYAGGFIPELDDGNTLILTAADAENTSFGCSEDSEMTYFGKALFKEVLAENSTIEITDAFDEAKALIEQWEEEQDLSASKPMIKKPEAILAHLKKLKPINSEIR